MGGRLRERRRRKHRGPDSERGAANKNTDDHEGTVSPCTRIVTCAGDRRICFPDGTDKLTRAHRQPGKALLLSIARSEKRRVGTECDSKCNSRWSQDNYKKN